MTVIRQSPLHFHWRPSPRRLGRRACTELRVRNWVAVGCFQGIELRRRSLPRHANAVPFQARFRYPWHLFFESAASDSIRTEVVRKHALISEYLQSIRGFEKSDTAKLHDPFHPVFEPAKNHYH